MKRSFVSIPWSKWPKDVWHEIVLINPSECITSFIKGNWYVTFKAYLPILKGKGNHVCDVTFPYWNFMSMLIAVPQVYRCEIHKPIKFEFMKAAKGKIITRNWSYL